MYAPILRQLPDDLRMTMLELIEAVEQNMRVELAVRREDFEQLQATVSQLAEAQERTEQRLNRIEAILAESAEIGRQTDRRLAELAEAQKETAKTVQALFVQGKQHTDELAHLKGRDLERAYRDKAYGYFGGMVRRARVVDLVDYEEQLLAQLSPERFEDVRLIDLVIRGRHKQRPDVELYLAVEVSHTVDRGDVERAQRRAAALRQAGLLAVPVVAGEEQTEGVAARAAEAGVVLLQDGVVRYWDEALRRVDMKDEE